MRTASMLRARAGARGGGSWLRGAAVCKLAAWACGCFCLRGWRPRPEHEDTRQAPGARASADASCSHRVCVCLSLRAECGCGGETDTPGGLSQSEVSEAFGLAGVSAWRQGNWFGRGEPICCAWCGNEALVVAPVVLGGKSFAADLEILGVGPDTLAGYTLSAPEIGLLGLMGRLTCLALDGAELTSTAVSLAAGVAAGAPVAAGARAPHKGRWGEVTLMHYDDEVTLRYLDDGTEGRLRTSELGPAVASRADLEVEDIDPAAALAAAVAALPTLVSLSLADVVGMGAASCAALADALEPSPALTPQLGAQQHAHRGHPGNVRRPSQGLRTM